MNTAWQLAPGGAPTAEPLTVLEAMQQLRLSESPDDLDRLNHAIRGARWKAEQYLNRGLLTQTWIYQQDQWSDEIQLPMSAPLQSVASVKYYTQNGVQMTLDPSAYVVDVLSEPGRIYRAPVVMWPSLQTDRRMAIQVTYVVGWTEADQVPGNIIDALYALIANRYEHRETIVVGSISEELPEGVEWMLAPSRVFWTPPRECDTCVQAY